MGVVEDTFVDPTLSNKNKLKSWLMRGHTINWKVAMELWKERNLAQRIYEVEKEFERDMVGVIARKDHYNPKNARRDKWTDYWLERYTDEEAVSNG